MAQKIFTALTIGMLCLAGILIAKAFTPTAPRGYHAPTARLDDPQASQPDPAAWAATRERQTVNAIDDIRKQLDRQEFDRKYLGQ